MSKKEMDKLGKELKKYAKAYELGTPTISDAEFDKMHTEYKELGGQPITMIIGGKVEHNPPMSSMADTFTLEDAKIKASREPYVNNELIFEPKWDGVSCSLIYKNGKLDQALTRGDGLKGNPIIYRDEIINVPKSIPTINDVVVRGELVIRVANFDYKKLSNPRNVVAGAVRKGEPGTIKKLKIEFIPWDVIFEAIKYQNDIYEWLECNNFETIKFDLPDVDTAYAKLSSSREEIPIDMDGLVVKINDKSKVRELGMGSKYSNSMYALKFRDKEYKVDVLDIMWQMGMGGQYTPVAMITPTNIDGVVVTKVTLHHYQFVQEAECGVGSEITIVRSGGVIPKYIRTLNKNKDYNIPRLCPHCESVLQVVKSKAGDGIDQLSCEFDMCIEKMILKLVHFTKRGYLDIQGLSKESISKLFIKGYLRDYPDLFKLKEKQLEEVLGVNGIKIYREIQSRKGLPYSLLFGSIYIPNGGRSVFKKVNVSMNKSDMLTVPGIGEETANSLIHYISSNHEMIDELIEVSEAKPDKDNGNPTITYGISGKIPGGRAELMKRLEEIGWKKTSGKSDYFIAGEGALTKKAKGKIIKVEDIPWNE